MRHKRGAYKGCATVVLSFSLIYNGEHVLKTLRLGIVGCYVYM